MCCFLKLFFPCHSHKCYNLTIKGLKGNKIKKYNRDPKGIEELYRIQDRVERKGIYFKALMKVFGLLSVQQLDCLAGKVWLKLNVR